MTPGLDPASALSMEQHAGIAVALAAGFARADVLSQERIDEKAYRAADVAWKKRLADDANGEGKLFAAYQAKRAEAEDWLGRKIDPLDSSLPAWLGFLKAWAAAKQPFEILGQIGITLADVGRLGRAWERAFARDDKLARRAQKLADEARMPAKVALEPAKLRPFPWSPGAVPAPPISPPEVEISETPEPPLEIAVTPVVPSYLLGEQPAAGSDAPPAPGLSPPPNVPVDSNVPVDPNVPVGPPVRVALPSYARNVAPDTTAPVFYLRGGDGLPFSLDGGAASPEPAPPRDRPTASKTAAARIGGTVESFTLPKGPVTPFEPPASRPASSKAGGTATPEKPAPRDEPGDASFGTVAVFELPKSLVLPFGPGAPARLPAPEVGGSAPNNAGAADPKLAVSPPSRPAIGETLPLDAPIPKPTLPFADRPPPPAPARQAPPSAPAGASAPPAGASAAPARAPARPPAVTPQAPPRLSLLDHATLCAEIALRPTKAAEALARCGIDLATKAALDAYFNQVRGQQPAADAAWNRAYRESYTRLMLSAWKGPGSR